MLRLIFSAGVLLLMPLVAAHGAQEPATATTHPEVQKALDWKLPDSGCIAPEPPGNRIKERRAEGGETETWDVDSYTLKRYESKLQQWTSCVDDYKVGLQEEFDMLKASAKYGLTQSQANIILQNMKTIQQVLLSPTGELSE